MNKKKSKFLNLNLYFLKFRIISHEEMVLKVGIKHL